MKTARLFHTTPSHGTSKVKIVEQKDQSNLPVWLSLNQWLKLFDEDTRFWWETTAPILGRMMELAGYSEDAQQKHLLFYYIYVLPSLDRRPSPEGYPTGWNSFMTDDYSPLEVSWDWGKVDEKPSVRFSIEPIGRYAGTPADPLNQKMVFQLVDGLRPAFHHTLDLTIFDLLSEALTTSREKLDAKRVSVEGCSQYFVAFDLDVGHPRLKAYFMPGLKAAEADMPVPGLVSKAMESCDVHLGHLFKQAFNRFSSDLADFSANLSKPPQIEIVGIDCVVPAKSRVKFYVRDWQTSFDSVCQMHSLGAKGPLGSGYIASLRELWSLVLGLPEDFSTTKELPSVPHRTSGILYYFEIKPNSDVIVPKVYIPVRHYGINDLAIAQGMATYFERRGQTVPVRTYVEELSNIL
jgi:DMATS type aromatic prenyltransferase